MQTAIADDRAHVARAMPAFLTFLLASASGLIVANLYYAQPLTGPIAASLGMTPGAAGLIVTLTQLGYGVGLLLIVPLGDIIENRVLSLVLIGASALALLGAALSTHPLAFLVAALLIGVTGVVAQVLVGYAAHLAPDAVRGRVVGTVMSGLMLGIMLARPMASLIAGFSSWHVVFVVSAAAMLLLAALLSWALPRRVPVATLRYGALLGSMARLMRSTPALRRRALYHSFLFGAFSLFWTVTPLLLAGPAFHLSQRGIALFALAGVAGAVVAPLAGRLADGGWTRPATVAAMLAVSVAFLLTHLGQPGSTGALALLVAAAILLDAGVTMHVVLSQRELFALGAEVRSRLNGLFMATFFMGGAAGSAVGGWAFARGGWPLASWIGLALPVIALACYTKHLAGRGPTLQGNAA